MHDHWRSLGVLASLGGSDTLLRALQRPPDPGTPPPRRTGANVRHFHPILPGDRKACMGISLISLDTQSSGCELVALEGGPLGGVEEMALIDRPIVIKNSHPRRTLA